MLRREWRATVSPMPDADGALAADEWLKHVVANLGIDAAALVFDPDLHDLAFFLPVEERRGDVMGRWSDGVPSG